MKTTTHIGRCETCYKQGRADTLAEVKKELVFIMSKYFQSTKDDKVIFLGKRYSDFVKEVLGLLEDKK